MFGIAFSNGRSRIKTDKCHDFNNAFMAIFGGVRALTAIFLVALLGFQMFLKVGIIGYYGINKDYIAANFCENASYPEKHCNGKCYLKKQIQKADKAAGDRQFPNQQRETHEIQPFIASLVMAFHLNQSAGIAWGNLSDRYAFSYSFSAFHPPAA